MRRSWCAWGAANGIAPRSFFSCRCAPSLLHAFNPQSTEKAFPCPRTWEMVSNIVHRRGGLDPVAERQIAVPGHRRRGRDGRVLGLLASLARAAPSPHRHRRSRGRRDPRQRQCADRALRLALQDGRRHQSRRHRHLRSQGSGERSASSSSAPASAASPRSSTPRPSSSGPPLKPADPISFWRPMP